MQVYRSPMEKILKQMEDNMTITNPKTPIRAIYNKLIYKFCYYIDKLYLAFRWIFKKE
jgi:hypothetical protein